MHPGTVSEETRERKKTPNNNNKQKKKNNNNKQNTKTPEKQKQSDQWERMILLCMKKGQNWVFLELYFFAYYTCSGIMLLSAVYIYDITNMLYYHSAHRKINTLTWFTTLLMKKCWVFFLI